MRDVAFKAEEGIEMELSRIYIQSSSTEACLLRLHGIFKQAVKQTDYLKKELIKIKGKHQFAKGPPILGWMRQRRLLLGSTSSQPADPECQNNIILERLSIKRWHFKLWDRDIQWGTSFLPNLKKLKFFETSFPWSDMGLIGMLPNLKVLKLINACEGKKWEPCEGGVKLLQFVARDPYCLCRYYHTRIDSIKWLLVFRFDFCKVYSSGAAKLWK
nr:putative late blight resistance protein homolog R1A-10 [Ipomoea trifida]